MTATSAIELSWKTAPRSAGDRVTVIDQVEVMDLPRSGVPRRLASTEAPAWDLGFTAAVNLDDGFRQLIGWEQYLEPERSNRTT